MKTHGEQMQQLSVATVLLRYGEIQRLAGRVADQPALGRPEKAGAGDVNAEVPEQFFLMQDNLRRSAKALAAAAAKEDDAGIARGFGDVSTSCISCHAQFLRKQ
jgi:cytochrome c556